MKIILIAWSHPNSVDSQLNYPNNKKAAGKALN